jgi:DNA-directed RNA polymerase specialized sigma24 family protein
MGEWLVRLKTGDADAIQSLWNIYSTELVALAKQRLGATPRGIGDEEDVALSAFGSICRGAAEGRFEKIGSRDELWWLLLSITKRKAVDHIRRESAQKRGGHAPDLESPGGPHKGALDNELSLDELISPSPTPDFLVALGEQYARLLGGLRDDRLRQIAVMRIEGYTDQEIAQRMSLSQRAIERKLQLIRSKWASEFFHPDAAS